MIVHMIGNAHIDPVWLWSWQAGVDEALATFRSAADRCDEYPEFIFTRGEAWLFEQVERIDPELFERVRRLVERGQWHITGGQYIQPDVNLSTVMGLHRQIIRGQRYFRDRFGVSPRVGYNVDSFGHPATLPDVLASHGYVGYVFHRPGAHQVELPTQTFRWRGVGGGEVIGFRISPAYVTFSDDLYGQIMLSIEAADPGLGHTMCFYGVGNHGGGPTKANIEYILKNVHSFPDAELRFSTPQAFFDAVAESGERLPLVTEELQHTFPGCYSVMHDIKQQQQRGEHLLEQCGRIVEGFVDDEEERRRLCGRLDDAWNDLLFTAFHDILAGTSVPAAWDSVRAMQGRARIIGEEVAVEVTRRWAQRALPPVDEQQIVVINPDDAAWEGMVETEPFLSFDAWGKRWLSDLEGQPIDFQAVQPEASAHAERVIFPLRLDGGQFAQVLVRTDKRPSSEAPETDLEVSPRLISNSHLRAELDGSGIHHLSVGGRNLLGEGGVGLHLRRDLSDTWTFHTDRFDEPIETVMRTDGWVVEENGPLRARVRSEGWLGRSAVRWTLTLHRDEPLLQMQVEINFSHRFKLLQMPIHLAAPPIRWTDGLPGGHVERTPGPAEWPVQGWSRVELADRQLALVTGDAYSLSLDGDRWQWTLLRSPKMAWGGGEPMVYSGRDRHTDQGPHTFDFALCVGERLEETMLHAAARQQMQPPVVFDRYEGMDRPPWGNSPPRALWLGAVERALADGRMSHLLDNEEVDVVRPLFDKPERDPDREEQTMAEFSGKVAIVAGGALGIGRAAARKLAAEGASVVICSDREGQVEEAVTELRGEGLEVRGLRADVTSSADMKRLVGFAVETYGGVDILVNSAGVQRYGTVVETGEEVWDEVLDVNLKGIYLASKHAIPEMRKRGGGAIVNLSSVQAFASQKGVAAYTASKGGINALTRAMALDHAEENIRVNAVCPASVDTPMLRWSADLFKGEKSIEETVEGWGKMHPMGRVARAGEVAEVIAFLASPRASFVTGGDYKVDGGMLAALGVRLPE